MIPSSWTPELDGALRTLWAAGYSTAEIGRRLGVTKNSVVGRAHRLDLPARVSPIKPTATPVAVARPGKRGCQFIAGSPNWLALGDAIYCGAELRHGSQYCEEHHARCWRPAEKASPPVVQDRAQMRAMG
jgi:GcrA cell cycle regulator